MRAVDVQGVSFTYDDGTEALAGIDFRVEEGEFVAVLGSNGSGKTTLIQLLVGLLKAKRGKIAIGGREIGSLTAEELYQRVGLVFQNPNDQLFAATVEEDCAFGPRNLNLPEAEVQRRITESLAAVAALPLRGRAIHHLSFGEQKRVSLAGVLAMRPAVLILDEPTAGLDPAGEAQMMQLLKKLNREEGMTVILATHSVDMLPLFANRIYVLDRGRVLQQGPSEDLL
jgi:cobalt/nickel transport system ATP-binding protein